MDLTLLIFGVILGIIGILGAIIPVLPGTILSYIGFLCIYFVNGSSISTLQLVICGIVSVAVIVLDYILPGYFSKLFGGTKYGITGATIGTIIGMFFGIVGIIIGPFIGAFIGEMIGKQINPEQALKVSIGATLAFIAGTGIKLIAGAYMLIYIIKEFIAYAL